MPVLPEPSFTEQLHQCVLVFIIPKLWLDLFVHTLSPVESLSLSACNAPPWLLEALETLGVAGCAVGVGGGSGEKEVALYTTIADIRLGTGSTAERAGITVSAARSGLGP